MWDRCSLLLICPIYTILIPDFGHLSKVQLGTMSAAAAGYTATSAFSQAGWFIHGLHYITTSIDWGFVTRRYNHKTHPSLLQPSTEVGLDIENPKQKRLLRFITLIRKTSHNLQWFKEMYHGEVKSQFLG